MRFVTRSLIGLTLLVLTLGLLALSAASVMQAVAEREAAAGARAPGEERVFAVNVARFTEEIAQPVLTAYGDVQSARELEVRATARGRLVELAPGFREGGTVAAGELLYRVDPAETEAELALARSDHAAAAAEEAEARAALTLAREDMEASRRQRDLQRQSLERARDLSGRGVRTAADLEGAELALATAEQALTGKRLALAQAEARIERAVIARDRAVIERNEAARRLEDTVAYAPFAGVLAEVTAVPGSLISENEKLGLLLDPEALEVAFRVSNSGFSRLIDQDGGVLPLEVVATLDVEGIALSVSGEVERIGASSGQGQTGRLVYARLEPDIRRILRPGDFVTVQVIEPPLEDVAVVPATAVSTEGRILVVDDENRLEAVSVSVLRRQGDLVIVAGVPFGRDYVTERLPQLGAGVLVRPVRPGAAADAEAMIRLTPERRAGLIAAVRANERLEEAAKERLLAALEAEAVPKAMIDRLESRTGG